MPEIQWTVGLDPNWPGVDQDTARKVIGTAVPGVASAVVANAGPDPSLPGPLGYIPFTGAAEGLAGTAGLLYNLVRAGTQKADKALEPYIGNKYALNLPPAPEWMGAAGQHLANTQDDIYKQIQSVVPHYTPTPEEAPDYEGIKAFSQVVGGAVPVMPGSAIGTLPKIARFFVPTTKGATTNLAIAGASAPALQYFLTPDGAQAAPTQGAPDQQPPPQPALPPDLQQQIGNIGSPFPQASQTATSSAPGVPDLSGIDTSGIQLGGAAGPAPTFDEEGESNLPWWKILGATATILGGIKVAHYMHGMGLEVTQQMRDARVNDPAYAQKAQDYTNEQVRVQAGQQMSNAEGGRTQPPLPSAGPVHSAAVAAQESTLDASAGARNFINLSSANPDVATKIANQFGIGVDIGRWQGASREFLITGKDEATGIKIPPPKELFDDIGELSPQDQKILNEGLHAANEMDNRNYNYGKGIVGPQAAHDFPNIPDVGVPGGPMGLVDYTQRMLSDPRLADIAHRFWDIGKGLVDIGEARGFFTPAEAKRMRAVRPNYLPEVGLDARITHALGPRNVNGVAGIDQVNTTAWSAMAQHIEELTRQMDINQRIVNPLVQHILDYQNNTPGAAELIREVPNPNAGNAPTLYPTYAANGASYREPIVSVRTGTSTKFYRVMSNEVYNWLKSQNANKTLVDMGIFDKARRATQLGTTGALATLTGRMFPLTHLARVSSTMQSNRPRGYVGSLSDALMQRLTGGRLGQRLVYDPTNIAGIGYSFARGQYDKFIRDLAQSIHPNSGTVDSKILSALTSPQQAQAMSEHLMNKYLASTTHEMAAMGASGTGMPLKFRPAAIALGGEGVKDVRLQAASLSPKLFFSGGKTGAIKPFFLNLARAFEEPYADLMDAGNQYFYRLNKTFNPDIDPASLTYETRALVGNPSTKGASALVRGYTQLEEYSNIAAQALARRGRSLNETPITSAASIVGQLGTIAALSLFTAMRNPQVAQYMENMITTQGRAANAIFFGNDDPQYHTEISLAQEVRWLYAPIIDLMSKALNTAAAIHDPMSYDGLMQFFKDLFSQHIENSTLESSLHGLGDAASFINIPSFMNILPNMAGKSFRIDAEKIINDALNHQLGMNTFFMDMGKDNPLPNHPAGDNLFEGQDGKIIPAIVSSVLGTVGGLIDDGMGLLRNAHHMDGFMSALGQTGKDWLQKAMDLNPELNSLLWENPVRESMRSPIVELTERRLNNMKLAGGPRNADMMEDTTGGKFPLPVEPLSPDDSAKITDPNMRDIHNTVQAEYAWINSHFIAEINQVKKQMQDYSQQPMDNKERREWMNNQTRWVSDKYRYINSQIDELNTQLSNKYGRRIDIGSYTDWKGTVDQWPKLK